jgi:hypothetical protein
MNCIELNINLCPVCAEEDSVVWNGRMCWIDQFKGDIDLEIDAANSISSGIINMFKCTTQYPKQLPFFFAAVRYYYPAYANKVEKLMVLI